MKTTLTLLLVLFVAVDLWLWVPFEDMGKVDWFFFVDGVMGSHWYIKLTTKDVMVALLWFYISLLHEDVKLKRVATAVGVYFVFQVLAMWSFDDKLPMTPFITILLIYCFAVITFGERYRGMIKLIVNICQKYLSLLK